MMKTLLSKKNIVRGVITILAVVLSLVLGGCSEIKEFYEEQRLEEEQEKEEAEIQAKRDKLYGKFEEIYLEYSLGENETLTQEFEKFLEEKFSNKTRILEYFERRDKYNSLKLSEYETKLENLEEEKSQISNEEYEKLREELEIKYEKDKNKIQDYLTQKEKEILENSEEEIENLYNIAKTTKGTK